MFLAGLAVIVTVAALDAVLGARVVLIELLVVGPLIAATGASPRHTAITAGLALALSIPLGWASDAFGSAEHAIGVVVVALGGLVSVLVAHLRSARERDAARLQAQYDAARVLADSDSVEEAAPRLLRAIGDPLGWEGGHLWLGDAAGRLERVGSWRAEAHDPDTGLAAEVWKSGRPSWVTEDASARGRELAFPVMSGDGCMAVVEFVRRDQASPNGDLAPLTDALGTQIGEFIVGLRAREAVRVSEARKSAVLDSALDGVITIDHEGRILEYNAGAERIFGHSAEASIGAELAELVVPPSLRERHREALRRCVETGESTILGRRIELSGMRADGAEFPVELALSRVEGAEPPVFTGVVRDITRRRQAEAEREELLRLEQVARLDATQARDQLEAILRGVADAVTAQAADGRLLFANEAAVAMLGYESSEALLGAPIGEVVERFEMLDEDGEPLPLDSLPGRRAFVTGEASEAIVRFRVRATGEERWSAIKATPIRDQDGRAVMAINVIEDISAHKRSELTQRFLAQSSAVLTSSLDQPELLQQVASLTVPELADWCAVDLRAADGGIERAALAHVDPAKVAWATEIQRRYPPDPDGPTGVPNVLRTGAAELYPEIPDELIREAAVDDEHYRLITEIGMRSAIIAPLIARDRTIGALTFVTGPSGRRFDERDLELASEIALRCAGAIDNARLYAERAYVASTLQQGLLPAELPEIPGIEAAARFRPTGAGTEVGGDFYDLFATGPNGWTVVMGDVCGKGPDAAAVTALARYTLRAAAMRERLPSRSLRVLNEALLRQRDDRRFCTVAYAYLEPLGDGARVGLASGGHPLPLLVHPDGDVEAVGAPGTLLGIVPDPRLEDRAVSLAPGDALVFYTDGVIESRGADGSLDELKLAELLSSCGGRGADAIAAAVEEAALRSNPEQRRDDIAVLVLRVAG